MIPLESETLDYYTWQRLQGSTPYFEDSKSARLFKFNLSSPHEDFRNYLLSVGKVVELLSRTFVSFTELRDRNMFTLNISLILFFVRRYNTS